MLFFVISFLLLPIMWLLLSWSPRMQPVKHAAGFFYLLLSWAVVAVSFSASIAVWKNQIPVRIYFSDAVAALPSWVMRSYAIVDAVIQRFPTTDLIQGAIYALPLLLIPVVMVVHSYRKGRNCSAFRYVVLNVIYLAMLQLLPLHKLGTQQIISLSIALLGYGFLLTTHFLAQRITRFLPTEERRINYSTILR